jgi:hypothetical protein
VDGFVYAIGGNNGNERLGKSNLNNLQLINIKKNCMPSTYYFPIYKKNFIKWKKINYYMNSIAKFN